MPFDIIIISDFRFPGGTSAAVAHEIRALHGAGYAIGLVQKRAPILRKDRPFHSQIARCLESEQAVLVQGGTPGSVDCRLALLHNPLVFTEPELGLPTIVAEQAVLVAQQPPIDGNGAPYYDVWTVQQNVAGLVGPVTWAPISPLSRQNMLDARLPFAILPHDWTHVFFQEDWICDRTVQAQRRRPSLGRHSRPEREKWPATRDEVLTIYPDTPEFDVRLLGVGPYLRKLVGEPLPANWTTYEFGEISPPEFLRSIDFFVYYHHPEWVEGFGRTIAEAAASGAVVILPEYLRTSFGDAAIYREAGDVLDTVRELCSNRRAYEHQSRTGVQAIDRNYGPGRLLQRIGRLIGEPDPKAREERKKWLARAKVGNRRRAGSGRVFRSAAFDVLHLADMQTRRETAWHIANLVRVEAAHSYRVGLINVGADPERANTIHPLVDELVQDQAAIAVHPSAQAVATKLLLIHGAMTLRASSKHLSAPKQISADQVIAIADAGGSYSRLARQDAFLKGLFGQRLSWAATTTKGMHALSGVRGIRVESDLWSPSIERLCEPKVGRRRCPEPVLGCIWVSPGREATKVAERVARYVTYADQEIRTRLMDPPVAPGILDDFWPENFEIFSSGEMSPSKFIGNLDFLAALPFGSSRAFGEELAAWAMVHGIPLILPHALEGDIGDGPIYAKAQDIAALAAELHVDPDRLAKLKRRTKRIARRRYSPGVHVARLRRLVGRAARRTRKPSSEHCPKRVLFLSSNGVGLGHLTRLLAIARRMRGDIEPVFATLSQAMPIVERAGYPVEYIPFHVYTNSDPHEWNKWLTEQLRQIIHFHGCKAVVFDGSMPYFGLIKAIAPSSLKAVWIRRGMWQEKQSNREALSRQRFFDLVIEPGDVADSMDRGATAESRAFVLKVPPISLLEGQELYDRRSARRHLNLDPSRPAVLVQLGSGWNRDLATMVDIILEAVAERPELQPVLVEWLISNTDLDLWPGVPRIRGFPITRYYKAFDFTISAAGYNSFNEVISFGLPAIFIANQHPMMDDQCGRATYASDKGAAFQLLETELKQIGPLLDLMLDENARMVMRRNCQDLARPNGAALAADAIVELLG